jgi:hypothetical protein
MGRRLAFPIEFRKSIRGIWRYLQGHVNNVALRPLLMLDFAANAPPLSPVLRRPLLPKSAAR